MRPQEVYFKRTKNVHVWIGTHSSGEPYPIVSDVYVKRDNHIIHQVRNWPIFKLHLLPDIETSCLTSGLRSPRPYRPGQACDGSIGATVLCLFDSFCRQHHLCPVTSYNTAYADRNEPMSRKEWNSIIEFGDWQTIAYPASWHLANYSLLLRSLANANYSSLIDFLLELDLYQSPYES